MAEPSGTTAPALDVNFDEKAEPAPAAAPPTKVKAEDEDEDEDSMRNFQGTGKV